MFTSSRFSPSKDQIRDAFEHVLYEIRMLACLPIPMAPSILSNCVTESYLIHARVLVEFFQAVSRDYDDILPSDYGFEASPLGIDADIGTRFNKSVAHITYSRLCFREEDATNAWINDHFRPQILSRAKDFLRHCVTQSMITLHAKDIAAANDLLKQIQI